MKIIEKKCPNCGAKSKFKIGDKETKCNYCNSEFIIEDNNKDQKNINLDDIVLNKKLIKTFSIIHMSIFIIASIICITMFIIVALNMKDMFNTKSSNTKNEIQININEIDSTALSKLKDASIKEMDKWNIIRASYEVEDIEGIGYYYLKSNLNIKIVYVLKSTYKSVDDTKTIYTAFTFNGKSIDSLNYNPYIDTNQIRLSEFEFAYGYESLEELYDKVIRSYKGYNYKIVATDNLFID